MPLSPFLNRFPDLAAREMFILHIQEPGLSLPPGEYAFFEWYCDDDDCDCRRVLLRVSSPQLPGKILATINYGWESPAFYTRSMHGGKEAGREITSAALDPINPQSDLADALLDGFRDYVRRDSCYPEQLQRHYEMFKSAPPASPPTAPSDTPLPSMDTFEILRQLNHVRHRTDFAPYKAALRAAVGQRESITPELIAALDRVSADPVYYLNNRDDSLHLFAIYLLAEFRESRALDSFLRFFSLPGEQSLELTGEMIPYHGATVLASVCAGDPAPLLQLALDESVNEFVRQQAIEGLLVQVGWNERPRDAAIANLRRLFHTLSKPGNPYVWASLVGAVCDFPAPELVSEARQAFAEELVDETVIDLNALDEIDLHGPEMFPPPHGEQWFSRFCERNAPICAVDECSAWVCFRDEQAEAEDGDGLDVDVEDRPDDALRLPPHEVTEYVAPQPYIAPPKTGRNEPCPCGSGKKYKKCCGNK